MLRTGFLTRTTGITNIRSEEKVIGLSFFTLDNRYGPCRTVHCTEATTRTFLFMNDGFHIVLVSNTPKKLPSGNTVFGSQDGQFQPLSADGGMGFSLSAIGRSSKFFNPRIKSNPIRANIPRDISDSMGVKGKKPAAPHTPSIFPG